MMNLYRLCRSEAVVSCLTRGASCVATELMLLCSRRSNKVYSSSESVREERVGFDELIGLNSGVASHAMVDTLEEHGGVLNC